MGAEVYTDFLHPQDIKRSLAVFSFGREDIKRRFATFSFGGKNIKRRFATVSFGAKTSNAYSLLFRLGAKTSNAPRNYINFWGAIHFHIRVGRAAPIQMVQFSNLNTAFL